MRLVDYAISVNDVVGDGLHISLSEDDMAATFAISKRMVTQSLRVYVIAVFYSVIRAWSLRPSQRKNFLKGDITHDSA